MQSLFIVVLIAAFSLAEPPPSKSYLPPSPSNNGYPQGARPEAAFPGAPQVIAARTIDQGGRGRGNSLSRSNSPNDGRFGVGTNQGYDENAVALGRNNAGGNSEPANYNFGYVVNDFNEGTDFGHHEERLEERAQGQYHVILPDGRKQTVSYEADENGFKPQVSYHDTEELTRSGGYDAHANTRNHGNGYDANASTRNHGNGYDANAGTRSRANGFDANSSTGRVGYEPNTNARSRNGGYDNANTRSQATGYDSNANTRNHGNGFKNAGHGDDVRGY